MTPNPGHCPEEAYGKRVRARLANGSICKDVEGPYPPGWAANSARWSKTGSPFDIDAYQVLG